MSNLDKITQNIIFYDTQNIVIKNRQRVCYFIKCNNCDKLHWKEEHELMRGIRNNSNFYCSKECRSLASYKFSEKNCCNCNLVINIRPSQITKSKTGNFFCNRSCAAIYNNKKYPKKIKLIKINRILKKDKLVIAFNCTKCNCIIDSNRKYCDSCRKIVISTQNQEKYISYIKLWQLGEVSGTRGEGQVSCYIRKYLFGKYQNKCSNCDWSLIHSITNRIPLEIDHIDGDWSNHQESNLRLLCPNCHAMTSTYRSLNNGKGRITRLSKMRK